MRAIRSYLAEESVIRLVLGRHEHDQDPVEELEAFERADTHVEEHSEQHRHGDHSQQGRHQHGQADRSEDEHVRHTVLSVEEDGHSRQNMRDKTVCVINLLRSH